MKFHNKSFLSKLGLLLAVIFLIPCTVGFASPYWLSGEFQLPVPQPINVKSHMGLLQSCKETSYPNGTVISNSCSSEGARDWQRVALGLAATGLFLEVLGIIGAFFNVFVKKTAGNRALKVLIAFFNIGCYGLMTATAVITAVNKKIQVIPVPVIEVDFDLIWAFYLSVASIAVLFMLSVLNIIDIATTQRDYDTLSYATTVAFNKSESYGATE